VIVRAIFRWITAVLFVAIVLEIGFAGYGAFDAVHKAAKMPITKKAIESGFDIHVAFGSVIVLAMLVLLIIAATGHAGPTKLKWSAALAALGVVQAILGSATSVPALGVLHGLVAVTIFVVAGILSHRTWTEDRGPVVPQARKG
jgi:hypothetical protein